MNQKLIWPILRWYRLFSSICLSLRFLEAVLCQCHLIISIFSQFVVLSLCRECWRRLLSEDPLQNKYVCCSDLGTGTYELLTVLLLLQVIAEL